MRIAAKCVAFNRASARSHCAPARRVTALRAEVSPGGDKGSALDLQGGRVPLDSQLGAAPYPEPPPHIRLQSVCVAFNRSSAGSFCAPARRVTALRAEVSPDGDKGSALDLQGGRVPLDSQLGAAPFSEPPPQIKIKNHTDVSGLNCFSSCRWNWSFIFL